jgi:hypothetical protein
MRCQGESCQEQAVSHITEVGEGAPSELHLCQRHTDLYLAQDGRLQEQLRKVGTARGAG